MIKSSNPLLNKTFWTLMMIKKQKNEPAWLKLGSFFLMFIYVRFSLKA